MNQEEAKADLAYMFVADDTRGWLECTIRGCLGSEGARAPDPLGGKVAPLFSDRYMVRLTRFQESESRTTPDDNRR